MSSKVIVASGPPKLTGKPLPVRPEINQLLANKDLKNLYLLALEEMQAKAFDKPTSWYALAGIHGGPFEPWNGELDGRGSKEGWYCTHSSVIFLTWHRPYLAIFEQELYNCVQSVLKTFSAEKQKTLKPLADNFRMPYWDWALYPNLPKDLTTPKIQVTYGKTGEKKSINNPLYNYKYPNRTSIDNTGRWRFRRLPGQVTTRETDSDGGQSLQNSLKITGSQWGDAGSTLNARDRVYFLLSRVESDPKHTFGSFSSNKWVPNGRSSDYDSLESVHDWLHGFIGGDMGDPTYAAFDPIFMMHHCNIDRLGALWQAMHPSLDAKYDFSGRPSNETFWSRAKTTGTSAPAVTPLTPLVPFRKSETSFWTSNDVKDFTQFGSTYPELTEWNQISREALKTKIVAKVKQMYGPPLAMIAASQNDTAKVQQMMTLMATPPLHIAQQVEAIKPPAEAAKHPLPKSSGPVASSHTEAAQVVIGTPPPAAVVPVTIPAAITTLVKAETHTEYFTNLRCPKYIFNGPYTVHVLLGSASTDAANRQNDPNIVGSWSVFASDISTTGCLKCKSDAEENLDVTGQVPLTGAILDRVKLIGSLDDSAVVAYLKKNLNWSLHLASDKTRETDLNTVVGKLRVSVTTVKVTKPADKEALPTYGTPPSGAT
ncbi:hypothetical protein EDC01DRAFT_479471 [Geopyxis carbonaria]|nr:hypothetical protein EDC01DRAFT_479471 [Geopyxis carbonaria]